MFEVQKIETIIKIMQPTNPKQLELPIKEF